MSAAKLAGVLLLSAVIWLALFCAAGVLLRDARCAGVVGAPVAGALHSSDAPARVDRGIGCR